MDYGTKITITCESRDQCNDIRFLHNYQIIPVEKFSVQMEDGRVLTNQNLNDIFPPGQWLHWALCDCSPPTIEFTRTLELEDIVRVITDHPETFAQIRGGLNDNMDYGNYRVEYRMANGYSRCFEFTNDLMESITIAVNAARLGNVYAHPDGWVWLA